MSGESKLNNCENKYSEYSESSDLNIAKDDDCFKQFENDYNAKLYANLFDEKERCKNHFK